MFTPLNDTALTAANLNEPSPPPIPFPSTQQQLWRLAAIAELQERQRPEANLQAFLDAVHRARYGNGCIPISWFQSTLSVGSARRPQSPSASRLRGAEGYPPQTRSRSE